MFATVSCTLLDGNEIECLVHMQQNEPDSVEECDANTSHFCGTSSLSAQIQVNVVVDKPIILHLGLWQTLTTGRGIKVTQEIRPPGHNTKPY